ncbi:hypothetical protein KsCSTR_32360 [Candidatus Kuenenia stuttgartiensis]|uniref:Uncharacterized protein n=1 Tax=Kuenenia stuttgartiensis TaxID=174633 RepID=Q1PV79_KUEST|nr:hypothetical protein KsCSTR_32360 [Candidatus Kuenenia stuttgartiensis]CAJ71131.1 unknown protein [Candidatus Kuenenia stuttgartiensis]CAJ73752.1 unknown protein [Candidatus Kuenenia stuttgartiensis]CAJ73880.1 unknown protein [Candidatus Kuenenia stuttgartiensis]CAJ74991.1 unknown protein [Candidatus Kuenenia stuttgartiensis]
MKLLHKRESFYPNLENISLTMIIFVKMAHFLRLMKIFVKYLQQLVVLTIQ